MTPEYICQLERARIRALVSRDMGVAGTLHSPKYQLITPSGVSLARDLYLGKIESGELIYLRWEPEGMHVRLTEAMAVVRYIATLELDAGNGQGTPFKCWHTDTYELDGGSWQAVWSQATAIK